MLPETETSFDRNWCGPEELKPKVYRTQSEKDTWYAVAVENEYECPQLHADDVVIDIGGHIGSFAYLAYLKGSRSVYSFEVESNHVEAGVRNLEDMTDGVAYYQCAVVRGDEYRAKQYYANGAWNAFGVVGTPIPSKSLDEIIDQVGPVRFLKIDCEGGEWPILYTCKQLDKIQQIAGEYHLIDNSAPEMRHLPPITLDSLERFLMDKGYTVQIKQNAETIGNFYAVRRPVIADDEEKKASEILRKIAEELEARGL